MARRRKQTHDPRQLSFFDIMANQIEEIREENIQDDMREEPIPAPSAEAEQKQSVSVTSETETKKEEESQPEPARKETPFPFPTNDGGKRRLGFNGRGDSVYELQDGSRMYSPNLDIMQFLDGEKRTPEKLFEAGADDFLTIQEISQFTHILPQEVQHARQTNLSSGNRKKGAQARNHQRREKRRIHQFGLFDTGSLGAELRMMYDDLGCIMTLPDHYDQKLEAMGNFDFDLKLYGQQQTEARALSSETARLASLRGMSDSEILESMGIDMSLKITE